MFSVNFITYLLTYFYWPVLRALKATTVYPKISTFFSREKQCHVLTPSSYDLWTYMDRGCAFNTIFIVYRLNNLDLPQRNRERDRMALIFIERYWKLPCWICFPAVYPWLGQTFCLWRSRGASQIVDAHDLHYPLTVHGPVKLNNSTEYFAIAFLSFFKGKNGLEESEKKPYLWNYCCTAYFEENTTGLNNNITKQNKKN